MVSLFLEEIFFNLVGDIPSIILLNGDFGSMSLSNFIELFLVNAFTKDYLINPKMSVFMAFKIISLSSLSKNLRYSDFDF